MSEHWRYGDVIRSLWGSLYVVIARDLTVGDEDDVETYKGLPLDLHDGASPEYVMRATRVPGDNWEIVS